MAERKDRDQPGEGGLGAAQGWEGEGEGGEGDEGVGDEPMHGVGQDGGGVAEPVVEGKDPIGFEVDVLNGPRTSVSGLIVDEMDGGSGEETGDDGDQSTDGGKGNGETGTTKDNGQGEGRDEDGGGWTGEEGEAHEESGKGEAGAALAGTHDAPGAEQGERHGKIAAFAFGIGKEEGGEGEDEDADGGVPGWETGTTPFDTEQQQEGRREERHGETDAEFLPVLDGSDPGGGGEGASEQDGEDPEDGGEDSVMTDRLAIDTDQGVEVSFDGDGSLDEGTGQGQHESRVRIADPTGSGEQLEDKDPEQGGPWEPWRGVGQGLHSCHGRGGIRGHCITP